MIVFPLSDGNGVPENPSALPEYRYSGNARMVSNQEHVPEEKPYRCKSGSLQTARVDPFMRAVPYRESVLRGWLSVRYLFQTEG